MARGRRRRRRRGCRGYDGSGGTNMSHQDRCPGGLEGELREVNDASKQVNRGGEKKETYLGHPNHPQSIPNNLTTT